MFPTAGYFRSTNCPFFVHGLCHRPYCHFRHSKPGLKSSKTKTSHKASVEELHNPNKAKTAVATNVLSVTKVVPNETETTVLSKDNPQNSDKNKASTYASKQLRGILKRSTSDDEDHKQPSGHRDLPLSQEVDQTKTEVTAETVSSKTEEPLESDDAEQPFPSLTDEEKLIIGFPLGVHNEKKVQEVCPEKSEDLEKASVSNSHVAETVDANLSCENKKAKQGDVGINHANSCSSDVTMVEEVKEIRESSSNEKVIGEEFREETKKETMGHEESPASVNKNVDVANDKSSKIFALKRKSVHLDISLEGGTQNKTTADLLCSVSKKRKSQQLPCNVDIFLQDKKLNLKGSGFEESVLNKKVTKQKFQCNSSFFEKVCDSGKLLFGTKSKHNNNTISAVNESKTSRVDDVQKIGEKTATKQSSVKKVTISEAGIDFFGSSKKPVKQRKTDKKKISEAAPSPQTSKPKQSSPVKKVQEMKKLDTKKPETPYITVESSDESDVCSPVFSDSSPEEEDQLKRIWDNFEPPPVGIEDESTPSPVKKQVEIEQPTKKQATKRALDKVDSRKEPSKVDALGLGKKQRVAHAPNHLPRRLSSSANPVRRYPKTIASVQRKDSPIPGPSSESSTEASSSCQPARKRIAHIPKNTSPAGSLPRPRIPVEYGAKVPQNQRQRYLDRIIDEYLRLCSSEKDAYEKAAAEEQALYERSTRRQVYLNLCVNSIKRLRGLTSIESNSSPAKTTAVTKTLPSGAVVVSTKSPGNEHRAPHAVSDQLTEELLYNCLSKYLMNEEDLVENGYPRPCPTSPGKAVIKNRKEKQSRDSTKRVCCRCGKPFVVLEDGEYSTKEECIYHAGKLFRKRGEPITNYSCCQGDAGSPGCCVGKVHVSDATCDTDGFMATIVSPLRENNNKVFAIDCEMCYTTAGLELTRITVVNWNLERVYDSFVCPERRIVDYNTRFSGVTEESLRGVTTTIREIQAVLLSMIHKDTILVGHSLESDLKAIKLIHSKVVDTSVVFPHRLGHPYKRALRNLMAEHLNKIIQDGVDGHDSHEDASACLELMRWRVKEDIKRAARPKGPLHSKQS